MLPIIHCCQLLVLPEMPRIMGFLLHLCVFLFCFQTISAPLPNRSERVSQASICTFVHEFEHLLREIDRFVTSNGLPSTSMTSSTRDHINVYLNRMHIFMRHFHRIRPHIHQSVHITTFANTEEAALQILHALRQMIDHEPTTHTETFTCKVTYNITIKPLYYGGCYLPSQKNTFRPYFSNLI